MTLLFELYCYMSLPYQHDNNDNASFISGIDECSNAKVASVSFNMLPEVDIDKKEEKDY